MIEAACIPTHTGGEMITKQKPLYDRVIVQRLEEEQPSGLIIRDVLKKEKPMRAKVVAVGRGRREVHDGLVTVHPLEVKVGDIVLIGKYAGTEYQETDPKTFKTTTYSILREEDILTVFE